MSITHCQFSKMCYMSCKEQLFSRRQTSRYLSGYWHVKLDDDSSLLTTFQTCFERYMWCCLPFGTKVSSELFQKHLLEALRGPSGIISIADDIVIYCKTSEPLEHGRREGAEATVHKALSSPSYDVVTATGRHYRRNRRHLRSSRPSEHDTTHDRADRPERMIPPSGVPRDRAHDPETVTAETNAAQQQETAAVSHNTRPSKVVVPEDTREHGPVTTRSGRVVRPVDRLNL